MGLVADVQVDLHVNGPWPYQLSACSYKLAVSAAVKKVAAEAHAKVAACVYQSHLT